MATTPETQDKLGPTDPPILLAGLIAARRTGDTLLATVLQRQLKSCGIDVRFLSRLKRQEARHE
jgi:hypothetical protein